MPRRLTWLIAWIAAVVPLLGWWTYGLFDLDEGFYGAITAEMNRRGEWITPYYNGHPWFEKPILLYWVAKPCLALFGTAIGPRVPSILATLLTLALIVWFVRRWTNERTALWAVVAYGTSILPVAAGRMMLTDPLLVLCLVATFLTFYESLIGDRRWRIVSAGALGLSVLAKGPVGGALFVVIAGLTYWRLPSLRSVFRGYWLAGVVLFLVVVSSWYVPAYLVHHQVFVQKFLVEQNLNRFTGGDAAHTIPAPVGWLFYIPVLALGVCPWVFLSLRSLFGRGEATPLQSYLSIWFWTVFGFFTLSGAKLPHYVLPCVAPLAVLAAIRLADREVRGEVLKVLAMGVGVWAFAQWAFTSYYYGIPAVHLPGFHAEVHRLAKYAADHKAPGEGLVVYQMGRQDKELGTGKPKIQETTHPSVVMVVNQTVFETDKLGEVLAAKQPVWIITRWNRIQPSDYDLARSAGMVLTRVLTPFEQDMYGLYRLTPVPR